MAACSTSARIAVSSSCTPAKAEYANKVLGDAARRGFGDRLGRGFRRSAGGIGQLGTSFIENPSGAKHYEFFPYESVTQVSAVGSLGAIPLDPATGQPQLVPPQR